MSRGHGRIQRAVLDRLALGDADVPTLAAVTYGLPSGRYVTEAQHRSTGRALRHLAAEGLVTRRLPTVDGVCPWAITDDGRALVMTRWAEQQEEAP